MRGYQYAHLRTVSRAGKPGGTGEGKDRGRRRNGEVAWSVDETLDEAERLPLASLQVPGDATLQILPGAASNFTDLRAAHDAAAAKQEDYQRKAKDGTYKPAKRKLRRDSHTLYSSVVSLPVLTEEALADPALRAECEDLLRKCMEHESRTVARHGGKMMMGVIHWDEKFVHVHLFALHPTKGRIDDLHPGRRAKAAFNREHAEWKESKPDALKRGANAAYCNAMREWQNDYHEAVFAVAGLTRFGPARARMTRKEWNNAMRLKEQAARDRAACEALEAELEAQEDRLAGLRMQAEAVAAKTAEDMAAVEEKEGLLRDREETVISGEAFRAAADRGLVALEEREVDYRPATADRPEGLMNGPNAPKEKEARRRLADAIRPARDWLVGVARRFFHLRQREEEQEREAADLRRRARVIADIQGRGPGKVDPMIVALLAGEGAPLEPESFPGAWSVNEHNQAHYAKLERTASNRELHTAYAATLDAVRLSDEAPGLQKDFDVGRQAIELFAARRGLDLETGRHDPARATEPGLAHLHTDQVETPIRIRRIDSQRQLIRS